MTAPSAASSLGLKCGSPLRPEDTQPAADSSALQTDAELRGWIESINASYGKSVAAIIKTGDRLNQAKLALGHGCWGMLFGKSGLRFGQRRAQMLMQIASHPGLSNPKYVSHLPASWSVLLVLTRLPTGILEQAIARGQLHADMTLLEANELAQAHSVPGTRSKKKSKPSSDYVLQWIESLAGFIGRAAPTWSTRSREQVAQALRQMSDALEPCSDRDKTQLQTELEPCSSQPVTNKQL